MQDNRHIRNLFDSSNYLMSLHSELFLPVSVVKVFAACALWSRHVDANGDPMSLEELAVRVGRPPSSISSMTNYLSEVHRGRAGYGLIRTFENPNNGRKKAFALTSKGQAVIDHLGYLYHRQSHEFD